LKNNKFDKEDFEYSEIHQCLIKHNLKVYWDYKENKWLIKEFEPTKPLGLLIETGDKSTVGIYKHPAIIIGENESGSNILFAHLTTQNDYEDFLIYLCNNIKLGDDIPWERIDYLKNTNPGMFKSLTKFFEQDLKLAIKNKSGITRTSETWFLGENGNTRSILVENRPNNTTQYASGVLLISEENNLLNEFINPEKKYNYINFELIKTVRELFKNNKEITVFNRSTKKFLILKLEEINFNEENLEILSKSIYTVIKDKNDITIINEKGQIVNFSGPWVNIDNNNISENDNTNIE